MRPCDENLGLRWRQLKGTYGRSLRWSMLDLDHVAELIFLKVQSGQVQATDDMRPSCKEAYDHEKRGEHRTHCDTGCRQVKSLTVFVGLPQCAISLRTVQAALRNGAKGKEEIR